MSQSWFTSNRERRLWGYTLAVLVAIYSTLFLASSAVGLVQEELAGGAFSSPCCSSSWRWSPKV